MNKLSQKKRKIKQKNALKKVVKVILVKKVLNKTNKLILKDSQVLNCSTNFDFCNNV